MITLIFTDFFICHLGNLVVKFCASLVRNISLCFHSVGSEMWKRLHFGVCVREMRFINSFDRISRVYYFIISFSFSLGVFFLEKNIF